MTSTIGFSGFEFFKAPFQVFSNNGWSGSRCGSSAGLSAAHKLRPAKTTGKQIRRRETAFVFMQDGLPATLRKDNYESRITPPAQNPARSWTAPALPPARRAKAPLRRGGAEGVVGQSITQSEPVVIERGAVLY